MEQKIHRPPVDITEIEKRDQQVKRVLHTKGKLSYAGNGGGGKVVRGGTGKLGRSSSFVMIGLAVLVSLVLCTLIFSTKGDANTLLKNQRHLETRIGTVETSQGTDKTRIDNIIANYALKADVAGLATKADLGSYATKDDINEAVSSIVSYHWDLTGTPGSYSLNVTSEPGTYVARVSLIYFTSYSLNVTTLEDAYKAFSGNWTGKAFVPEFRFNGIAYEVLSASFYTTPFIVGEVEWSGPIGTFSAPGTYKIGVEIIPILD